MYRGSNTYPPSGQWQCRNDLATISPSSPSLSLLSHSLQVMKDPLWGNRPVKEVKRALSKASASSIRTTEPSVESNEPLLVEDGGENKDIRPLDGPSRIHHDSALEFECEDEGVTVGGSR